MARASLKKHPWSPVDWITRAGAVMRARCRVPRQSDSARLHMSSQVRRVHVDAKPIGHADGGETIKFAPGPRADAVVAGHLGGAIALDELGVVGRTVVRVEHV